MLVSVTTDVVRLLGQYARRADTRLALAAAANARASVAQHQLSTLEEARVLEQLRTLGRAGRAEAWG